VPKIIKVRENLTSLCLEFADFILVFDVSVGTKTSSTKCCWKNDIASKRLIDVSKVVLRRELPTSTAEDLKLPLSKVSGKNSSELFT